MQSLVRGTDPSRFALGVALPLDEAAWPRRANGEPRDLALRHGSVPPASVFARLNQAIELSEQAGFGRIVRNLRSGDLHDLFVDADVVVIMAHAPRPGTLELADGVLDGDALLHQVGDFTGCLDLVACYSEALAHQLRFARSCIVAGRLQAVSLVQELLIYLETLARTLEQERPYAEVRADLLVRWSERT